MKKGIRRDREDWEELKERKLAELAQAKKARDEGLDEIERREREDRQQRRQAEEAAEKSTDAGKSEVPNSSIIPEAATTEDTKMDVEGEGANSIAGEAGGDSLMEEGPVAVDSLTDRPAGAGAQDEAGGLSIKGSAGVIEGEDELDFE